MKILEFKHNDLIISLQDLLGSDDEYSFIHQSLSDPEILEFYEGRDKNFSFEDIKEKYSKKIDIPTVSPCMIMIGDKYIGYLQFFIISKDGEWNYEHFGVDYYQNMYSIDIFISDKQYWGMGIGSVLLNRLAEYLLQEKSASKVYIDPRVVNERAIRSYEKAGFCKIKVLKEHEMFEGIKMDSWLLEYLG